VSLYDLNGAAKSHKRESMRNIAMARNSAKSDGGRGSLSVSVSSVIWYPIDTGVFATTDFDGIYVYYAYYWTFMHL
jgi:hypothetical protein